ncbi:MAG: molybdopterin-synthase adenylyltransferase MoeB, partial [Chromatiales bacterium]|nr:molybdopterin-synthase adenylyltransferase MoeB [Chromatiales bacterium]
SPLTGVIGSMMAVATLKILLGLGDTLCGRLLRFDAMRMKWRESLLIKDPQCPNCVRQRPAVSVTAMASFGTN